MTGRVIRTCLMCQVMAIAWGCAGRQSPPREAVVIEPSATRTVDQNPDEFAAHGGVTTQPDARVLQPGDQLRIRLPDFVAEGVVSEFRPVVDATGHIELPQLGRIAAADRTPAQVSDAIAERAPYALVYPIDAVPTPQVELLHPSSNP